MTTDDRGASPRGRPVLTVTPAVTGRDGFIILKALAYGVAAIQSQPPERQEGSDCEDMARLFRALVADGFWRDHFEEAVLTHFGRRPDLTVGSDPGGAPPPTAPTG